MAFWQLKRGVHWIETEGDTALFYHFGNRLLIRGAFVNSCLRTMYTMLQSPVELGELEQRLHQSFSQHEIKSSWNALQKSGFLCEINAPNSNVNRPAEQQDTAHSSGIADFLDRYFPSRSKADSVARRAMENQILLINVGCGLDSGASLGDQVKESLESVGFRRVNQMIGAGSSPESALANVDRSTLLVLMGCWLNLQQVSDWNRYLKRHDWQWLNAMEDEFGGTLGPYLGLRDGPCFECLRLNRFRHLDEAGKYDAIERYFSKHPEQFIRPIQLFTRSFANAIAFETLKILAAPVTSRMKGGLIEFDYLNHRSEFHSVLPLSTCPVCRQPHKLDESAQRRSMHADHF